MRKGYIYLLLVLLAAPLLTSCLGDDDETVVYDDVAISQFSLGTLKYNKRVNADSVLKTTLDCSSYKFNIDQVNGIIYNPDSLPAGVDVSKAVTSAAAKNSGTLLLKSATSDTLYYYNSSDSIDFTTPRVMRVVNSRGTSFRSYTITVNVHQEYGDTLKWNNPITSETLAQLTAINAISVGSKVMVTGLSDGKTVVYVSDINDGKNWTKASKTFDGKAYANVATMDDKAYILSDGTIYSSTDGTTWTTVATQTGLTKLLGASKTRLYGISDNAITASADQGKTWTKEQMDDDASLLPTRDISFCYRQLTTNSDAYRLIIIGNRDAEAYPADTTAEVWGKIEEAESQTWSFYNHDERNPYLPRRLSGLKAIRYDGDLIALGGKGLGADATKAFSAFYRSKDDGITWVADTLMSLPATFSSSETAFALTVDADNNLWLIGGGTGQVWRGRINRLGWKEDKKAFEQ